MKKIILGLLSFTFLLSCGGQEDSVEKVDLTKMKIDLKNSKLNGEIKLFTFSNTKELISEIDEAINLITEDSKEIIKNNSEVTNVITNISFINGKAIISKILYVNYKTKKIIEGYELDTNSNTYALLSRKINWDEILGGGGCPNGYSQLASCGNFSDPQTCVGNAIQTYLSANISGPGDCANVQVNVGALNTRVCGRTC
jgi:hypothetical protein